MKLSQLIALLQEVEKQHPLHGDVPVIKRDTLGVYTAVPQLEILELPALDQALADPPVDQISGSVLVL